jgi:hypothetical protein
LVSIVGKNRPTISSVEKLSTKKVIASDSKQVFDKDIATPVKTERSVLLHYFVFEPGTGSYTLLHTPTHDVF